MEDLWVVIDNIHHFTIVLKELVQLLHSGMDLNVVAGKNLTSFGILHRVQVYLQILEEQFTKGFQDTTAQVSVIFFVKNIHQVIHAHRQTNLGLGVIIKVFHQFIVLLELGYQHRMTKGAEQLRTVHKVLLVNFARGFQVGQGNLKDHNGVFHFHRLFPNKNIVGFLEHVHIHLGHWPETTTKGQDIFLVQHCRRQQVVPIRTEHYGIRHIVLNKLKTHQAVIDISKVGTCKVDHINL